MTHAITVGGLLLTFGIISGFVCFAAGLLMLAAASMSDAGDDGTGKSGCIAAAIGAVLLGGCIFGLLV